MIWLSEGKNKCDIKNKKSNKQTKKKKNHFPFVFHHNFVVSLLSFVGELVRRHCSLLSFDIVIVVSGCSITIAGNCWLFEFIGDSFGEFINGRSSSGPRKFKLNLRILKRKMNILVFFLGNLIKKTFFW